jgi:hypothetical protein
MGGGRRGREQGGRRQTHLARAQGAAQWVMRNVAVRTARWAPKGGQGQGPRGEGRRARQAANGQQQQAARQRRDAASQHAARNQRRRRRRGPKGRGQDGEARRHAGRPAGRDSTQRADGETQPANTRHRAATAARTAAEAPGRQQAGEPADSRSTQRASGEKRRDTASQPARHGGETTAAAARGLFYALR